MARTKRHAAPAAPGMEAATISTSPAAVSSSLAAPLGHDRQTRSSSSPYKQQRDDDAAAESPRLTRRRKPAAGEVPTTAPPHKDDVDGTTAPDTKKAPRSKTTTTTPGPKTTKPKPDMDEESRPSLESDRLLPGRGYEAAAPKSTVARWTAKNQWVVLAVASGACAAFNGVFAKLTTSETTSNISSAIAGFLGMNAFEDALEVAIRCIFFGLNLAFNGVMWTLFTQALARGTSTTQVSIMNTSSNFVLTAVLGLALFSESLPPLWWLGAAMLVAGNVIIGRKDEGGGAEDEDADADAEDGGEGFAAAHAEVLAEPLVSVQADGEDLEKEDDILDLGTALDPGVGSSSSSVVYVER